MNRYQEMVQEFHVALDIFVGDYANPKLVRHELRAGLIDEEARETVDAFAAKNLPDYVDGLCDLVYVAYGAAIEAGLDLGDDPFMVKSARGFETSDKVQLSGGSHGDLPECVRMSAARAAASIRKDRLSESELQLVLLIRTCHEAAAPCGIQLLPFFEEVHRANMLKRGGPLREDGKRLKPPGWRPPKIREMLFERGWVETITVGAKQFNSKISED